MNHRILKVLICMALVLSLASSGVCAVFATHAPETPCQKSLPTDRVTTAGTSGSCEMLPCHAKDGQPVLLPDASVGRSKTEDRQAPQPQGPAFILESLILFSRPQGGAIVLKVPFSAQPPSPFLSSLFIDLLKLPSILMKTVEQ
ncbi:MAG: hypothetical protein U5R49_04855 [Deltaproteobacteria bacterium]|nr:hypothetical protein [Deltaproteobacteria bacterium]